MSGDIDPRLKDFRNYLFLLWEHLNLPPPTAVQYDIAHYLQHGCEPEELKVGKTFYGHHLGDDKADLLGVEAFRGVGKSWITSGLVTHDLYIEPESRELVVSANSKRAKDFTIFTRRLIEEWPLLQHLRPRRDQRDSVESFDVGPASNDQSPSVKAAGITGQITGSRASRIVPDDVEIPTNSDTVAKREILSDRVKEFSSILKPGGKVTYLGTPQTDESIYNKVLIPRGYRFRIWPARVPSKARAEKYGELLAPMVRRMVDQGVREGTPVEPSRFSEPVLTAKELDIGRSTFALQFMLDTSMSDAERYPLRCTDFTAVDCRGDLGPVKTAWASSPELAIKDAPVMGFSGDRFYRPMYTSKDFTEWQGCVMTIDPKGRGKDELGYAVVKMLNGNLFTADCKGLMGGYGPENLEALANIAKKHKVKKIIIESNFGDGMFLALFLPVLARIYDCSVEEVRHNIQKEKRIIDTLEPVMNQHRLMIDPQLIFEDAKNYNEHPEEKAPQYSLIHQLTHITREKGSLVHDDRLDALAMAVAYWVEIMGKDDHGAVARHKQRLFDQELEKCYEAMGVTNGLRDEACWIPRR